MIAVKNAIFEEKTTQINLRRRKEEIKSEMSILKEDLGKIEEQVQENMKRKYELAEKITSTTEQF